MASRPPVVELVGPAGVGKTKLSLDLEAHGHCVRRTIWYVPPALLARSTLRQVPTALALYRATGSLLWDEVKHFARLDALHDFLRTTHWNGTSLVLLDEGPVYTLSYLQVIGHARFRGSPPVTAWRRALERWARSLDAIVILDAPDAVLSDRIRKRAKPHLLKDGTEWEMSAFATAYRLAFERVIVNLRAMGGGPPVLRLDCADGTDHLRDRLLTALRERNGVHAS
ncbi:MAG TPA: hypothetical protein VG454_04105 [Gemmatimonadales bacterium]|nr:hypothetical protein [Gemmatimonadales bacterium]